jgi:DNA polymerase-1
LHLTAAGGAGRYPELKLISIAGDYGQALLAPELLSEVVPLLEHPACKVIGHNLLLDMGVVRANLDRRLKLSNLWDVKLAMQMLNNGLPYEEESLQAICRALLGWRLDESPLASDRQCELSARQLDYASRVSTVLERVYAKQKALIEKHGLARVARVEFEAIPALAEMEYNGIGFNKELGQRLRDKLVREKDELEKELWNQANSKRSNKQFNPRNPQQVKKLLQSLGYFTESTTAADLERILLKDPDNSFIRLLLKYRELRQNIGFLKNWVNSAGENRIYPRLEQLGGRSGRITCSRPNIQQVPRDPSLKGLFTAAPGMSLVEADFSAIEMRIIAVLSGDEVMLKIFKKGLDPHKQTAQAIFQKAKISDEERQIAKTLNYGTVYGGGANMVLSKLPNLTEDEARDFLYRFYGTYPGLKRWQQKVTEGAPTVVIEGVEYKISKSALGRIRYVDPRLRNALINTPVQASGSDLQKMALGRLYEKLALPKYSDFKLINAVHDSILLEVPDKRAREAAKLLQGVMEGAGNEMLKIIPCTTDAKIGKDWSFKKDKHRFGLGTLFSKAFSIFRRDT